MNSEKTRAVVLGATGFTGREVVAELVARKIPVVAHVRPDSPRLAEWRERFLKLGAEVDATPWNEKPLTETLSRLRPDYIFACLGTTRARMGKVAKSGGAPQSQSYEAVDYGLTVMALNAAKAVGLHSRFVYLSALGGGRPGATAYGKWRFKTEQVVIQSGLPYSIARPSFIIGPGRDDRRFGELIGAKTIDAVLELAGLLGLKKLRDRLHSISNATLARALVRIALDPNAENKVCESEQLRP